MVDYDVVIVGGGPAGLTAGIYCVRRALKAVVVERQSLGGTMQMAAEVDNWPGDRLVKGVDLSSRMADHAKDLGVEFIYNEVISLDFKDDEKTVTLRDRQIKCAAIILATGGVKAKLSVKGEIEYLGKGVSYCATCDGPFFKGKDVAVVGSGNMAVEDAIYLSEVARKVYLIFGGSAADARLRSKLENSKVELVDDSVSQIGGSNVVEQVVLDSGRILPASGVFICQAQTPSTELAEKAGVELDGKGFIKVDKDMATNLAGVYAAGDVVGGIPQIVVAAGEGAVAALKAYEYVRN